MLVLVSRAYKQPQFVKVITTSLNGSKRFITNAGYADVYLVMASIDRAKGPHGVTSFLVDNDTPGFKVEKGREEWDWMVRQPVN